MDSFQCDQAEGLRRLLGENRQRIYTCLSAVPRPGKNHVLFNLAASLCRSGSSVMLLDATCSPDGVGHYQPQSHTSATLAQVARREYAVEDVFYRTPQDFDVVCLASQPAEVAGGMPSFRQHLDLSFESAAEEADIVLIDARLDKSGRFPLTAMEENAQVLLVEDTEKSIKEAYALIKRVSACFGRKPFGVLVSGSDENRSQAIFRNMSQAAAHYLGIQLYDLGYVPKDEHMAQAASLGRSVVDAFPMAMSSFAFRRIAGMFSDMGASRHGVYEMAGA